MTPEQIVDLRTGVVPDDAREPALIVRILAGEPKLYHDLIRLHEESVYFTAFSVLQNPVEAEEVAQESALKGYRNLAQFPAESHFSTWLLKITINEACTRLCKQHRELWESRGAP